jgi:hypothetical protein
MSNDFKLRKYLSRRRLKLRRFQSSDDTAELDEHRWIFNRGLHWDNAMVRGMYGGDGSRMGSRLDRTASVARIRWFLSYSA